MIRKYLTQQQYDDLDGKLNSNVDYVIVENGSPINVTFVTNNITGLDEMYDFAPSPEGSYKITANGEYDVTAYASAYVDVPTPEGTYNITENGEYDVTAYASAYVDVPRPDGVWQERYNSLFNNTIEYIDSNTIPSGTTSLRSGLCFGNSHLTYIDAPDVTSVGNNAFDSCSSLTSVNLLSVTSIDDYCFSGCTSFTSVNLPDVTSIGESAFYGCTSLTSVNLPSIVSIGGKYFGNTFGNCTKLTTVDLGPNVTSIGQGAFNIYNSSLTSFTCRATTPPALGSNVFGFNGAPENLVIYVPAESVDAYKAASGWSDFANKIQAIAE